MGHFKTSIAPSTCVLNGHGGRQSASGRASSSPPTNPREGQRWNDMVWDGFAWVSADAWRAQQARR